MNSTIRYCRSVILLAASFFLRLDLPLGAQTVQPGAPQQGTMSPQTIVDLEGRIVKSQRQTFRIEVVARNVETPWGLAFLPDGRLLITERPGRLRILANGQLSDAVKGTPTPHVQQDGGYLDVTVHPQYARNGWIYLSYSEVQPGFTPAPP